MTTPINQSPSGQKSLALLLDEMEGRAHNATPDPWKAFKRAGQTGVDGPYGTLAMTGSNSPGALSDAEFIASSRTDIPLLVKALRRAMEALEEPEAQADRVEHVRQNALPLSFGEIDALAREATDYLWHKCGITDDETFRPGLATLAIHRVIKEALQRAGEATEKRNLSGDVTKSDAGSGSPKVLSEITAILEGKEQEQDSGEPGATNTREAAQDR